ncbi:MAG: FkbM family methyltransferase [Jatrophihabitans sp.]|uniref:FkbM family methyltransferase n=1 Tax=Jatrophihabitans sp. TaxID=1932789 RepID=UPI003F7CE52D
MTPPPAARTAALSHRLRRVAQTPRTFTNWPTVLRQMSQHDLGRGRVGAGAAEELTFVARSGQRITCPNVPGARVPVYEVYAEDCYRFDEFLGPLREQPLRVLDIGAHVGAFACRLAQFAPKASIESFEPSAATVGYLRRNVAANGLTDRVQVFAEAVASTSGWAEFADNGAGSALNGLTHGGDSTGTTRVRTVAFDEVVGRGGPVDVVKIDCEGGEYDLVLNSDPAHWASVQRVVVEYHPSPEHSGEELTRWFAARGLERTAHEPAGPQQGVAWYSRDARPGARGH